jgi:hypothetical protein
MMTQGMAGCIQANPVPNIYGVGLTGARCQKEALLPEAQRLHGAANPSSRSQGMRPVQAAAPWPEICLMRLHLSSKRDCSILICKVEAHGLSMLTATKWFAILAAVPLVIMAAEDKRGEPTKRPLKSEGLQMHFVLEGPDLADLDPRLPIDLPLSLPPYRFEGLLTHESNTWSIHNLLATVGKSDVSGDLMLYRDGEPPLLQANLYSEQVNLRPFLGAPAPGGPLIPDTPIDVSLLGAIEALVLYRAEHIQASEVTFEDVLTELSLRDGFATIHPLKVGLVGGTIQGKLEVMAQAGELVAVLTINIRQVDLNKVFGTLGIRPEGFGTIHGQIEIKGSGQSIADVLASADGNVRLVMEGGRLDALLVQGAELDIGQALVLNASNKEEAVKIRCLVAEFKVRDGLMKTQTLLIDTFGTKIVGHGTVELGARWFVDITLLAHAKDFSLLAGDAPVHVLGSMQNLSIDVELGRLVFSLLTPIELGLADDTNCQQLTHANPPQ